jgi:hypothetical protein
MDGTTRCDCGTTNLDILELFAEFGFFNQDGLVVAQCATGSGRYIAGYLECLPATKEELQREFDKRSMTVTEAKEFARGYPPLRCPKCVVEAQRWTSPPY